MKKHIIRSFLLLVVSSSSYAFDMPVNWSTWDNGLYIDHFKVYWGTSPNNYTGVSDAIPGDQTTFTVKGLIDQQDYYFAVKAFDSNGYESAFSNEISNFAITTPNNNFLINKSNYKSYKVAGVGVANSYVEIFINNNSSPIASTNVKTDGSWSTVIDFTDVNQGPLTIKTIQNSSANTTVTGVYDRVAPAEPYSIIIDIQ